MRSILLNPGPVSLSERVRKAATARDLCHREPEFFELQDRVRERLLEVYGLAGQAWTAVLLGGSGTTALEAMVSSLLSDDSHLLVLENGVYGERLNRIAEVYGIRTTALRQGWLDAWNMEQIASSLTESNITHVAAVHHETTTGRLNPVDALARVCEQQGVRLLLDTVSSFAAEAIPFDSDSLAACAVTANKCLHGIPGSCFVVTRRSDLESGASVPRSLTLNLKSWSEHQDRRSTPFTPPVNSLLALDEALDELSETGGWHSRHARYHRLADSVARKLDEQGVTALLAPGESSCVLRSYRIPEGMTYEQIHSALKQHGFVIYGGQGKLASELFRISTMGDISDYDMGRLLTALEYVFQAR